jgi:hypothetical protein
VKKFAVIALSLGLIGALPVAHAAVQTVDAGTFTLTYDDTFLAGSTFSSSGGSFTFSGALAALAAGAPYEATAVAYAGFNGWNGGVYPIVLTPKDGYVIAGVAESVAGAFSIVGGEGQAGVEGGFMSDWKLLNGVENLGVNMRGTQASVGAGESLVNVPFTVGGDLDFAPVMAALQLSPGAVVLSSIDFAFGLSASGLGASATGTVMQYQLDVKTAMVPEPESLGLALVGLCMAGFKLGRRKAA